MHKGTVTVNADGSYTVKGGRWFWCRVKRSERGIDVLEMAPGMLEKTASRLFISQAKLTIEKHFPLMSADIAEQVIVSEIIEEESLTKTLDRIEDALNGRDRL